MNQLTIKDISEQMRRLDVCMLTTIGMDGTLESCPMSNNRDVDFTGDCYFFTLDKTRAAHNIAMNPEVCLAYEGSRLLGLKSLYISLTGRAELIRDRAQMEPHWLRGLEVWFKQGLDTPGLVMIHVQAMRASYWDGFEQGDLELRTGIYAQAS